MKLRLVPPSQGFVWLRNGLMACWQQSIGYMGLMGLVSCVILLLLSLPLLGPLIAIGAMPMVWMGFMLATRRVLTGQRITPGVLLEPVRPPDAPKQEWLKLGAAYVAALILVMQLASLLGPGADTLIQEAQDKGKDLAEVLGDPQVQADLLWRMGLTLPVSLAFWHTPALIMWARVPVGKALFFSMVASWRNLGAFALYGLGWAGVAATLGVIVRAVAVISPEPVIAEIAAVILGMWATSAFYASLYFTVIDCFDTQSKATNKAQEDTP